MLHETFNLAMLWKLPVIFICENNNYAMGTSIERTSNVVDIYKLADAYEGLHHHLIIRFKHQPDELNSLFTKILGLENYITGLHYDRREHGRSTYGWVCIKSASKDGYKELLKRMNTSKMEYTEVTKDDFLFKYLI